MWCPSLALVVVVVVVLRLIRNDNKHCIDIIAKLFFLLLCMSHYPTTHKFNRFLDYLTYIWLACCAPSLS